MVRQNGVCSCCVCVYMYVVVVDVLFSCETLKKKNSLKREVRGVLFGSSDWTFGSLDTSKKSLTSTVHMFTEQVNKQ